jgi:hypothetical protein
VVAPGRYWTAVNIHNPEKCKDARFRWKVAVADRGEEGPVPVYQGPLGLGPDRAIEIDCHQVMQALPVPAPGFVKGYVVIESDIELDVVAVYTGTNPATGALTTFHTERVQPRCVPVCEDLVLPLHTGLAAWQTVAPTPGQLGPVVPIAPLSIWALAPAGSLWVSQLKADESSADLGERHYELCFDLCSGFEVPAPFDIDVVADDSARVFLNGTAAANLIGQVGNPSGGGGFQALTRLTVQTGLLRVGRNCFRVEVTNGPPPAGHGPTGFALAGILHVPRGKCPCAPLPIAAVPPPGAVATKALEAGSAEDGGTS